MFFGRTGWTGLASITTPVGAPATCTNFQEYMLLHRLTAVSESVESVTIKGASVGVRARVVVPARQHSRCHSADV